MKRLWISLGAMMLAMLGYTHWVLATVPNNDCPNFTHFCRCYPSCTEKYCSDDISGGGFCASCAARGVNESCTQTSNGEPSPCGRCSAHCTHSDSSSSSSTSGGGGDDIDDDTGSSSSTCASITVPAADAKLVMSSVNTTITTLTGTHVAPGCPGNLDWEAEGFNFPNGAQGDSVAINMTEWPENNSSFGEKTITCTCSDDNTKDEVNVTFFFDAEASVNGAAAWFVYWSENSIVENLDQFVYYDSIPNKPDARGSYLSAEVVIDRRADGCLRLTQDYEGELRISSSACNYYISVTPVLKWVCSDWCIRNVARIVTHELDHKSRTESIKGEVISKWNVWYGKLNYRGIHFAGLDPHVVVQGALWKRIQRIRKNWN